MRLYPFSLAFNENCAAFFPFIYRNNAVQGPFCFISSKKAGDMALTNFANREAFVELIRPGAKVFAGLQTHSKKVALVEKDSPNIFEDTDGLVSFEKNAALTVSVADCLPVFLYDTGNGALGVVHTGWKGTGIVLEALRLMGGSCARIAAVLGPCICGKCYAVDEERQGLFEKHFGGKDGTYPLGPVVVGDSLGLQAANARLLANAGVEDLAFCTDCTFTDERLGSFRREGEGFTRMLAGCLK